MSPNHPPPPPPTETTVASFAAAATRPCSSLSATATAGATATMTASNHPPPPPRSPPPTNHATMATATAGITGLFPPHGAMAHANVVVDSATRSRTTTLVVAALSPPEAARGREWYETIGVEEEEDVEEEHVEEEEEDDDDDDEKEEGSLLHGEDGNVVMSGDDDDDDSDSSDSDSDESNNNNNNNQDGMEDWDQRGNGDEYEQQQEMEESTTDEIDDEDSINEEEEEEEEEEEQEEGGNDGNNAPLLLLLSSSTTSNNNDSMNKNQKATGKGLKSEMVEEIDAMKVMKEEEDENLSSRDESSVADDGHMYRLRVEDKEEHEGEEEQKEDQDEDDEDPIDHPPKRLVDDSNDSLIADDEENEMDRQSETMYTKLDDSTIAAPMADVVDTQAAGQGLGHADTSYSTRGRGGSAGAGGGTTTELVVNGPCYPWDRSSTREALGEGTLSSMVTSIKEKDRESFLSDAITEEERRTRTRYIPSVEGMHPLRKHEVKIDLALARSSSILPSSLASTKSSKALSSRRGANAMVMEGEGDDDTSSVEEDPTENHFEPQQPLQQQYQQRAGSKVKLMTDIGSSGVAIPSPAFVPPSPSPVLADGTATTTTTTAPREVDCTTAFNPPRPPESVGSKKKHRMLRWERRPADIEVDLNNYRKTVYQTKDELRRTMHEYDRMETVDNHLRRHYLHYLDAMDKELNLINRELSVVQQECVNAADLLTSRTRSRGAGKSTHAMRDVLTVLRTRGQDLEGKGVSVSSNVEISDGFSSGLGGVNYVSLKDWDRDTIIKPMAMASCWIVPGDSVTTPYGDGEVVAVSSPKIEIRAPPLPNPDNPDSMDLTLQAGVTSPSHTSVAAKVTVRLPFGVGFFQVHSVSSKEDSTSYSDARLALRWKGIISTGVEMGSYLDVAAMSHSRDIAQMVTDEDRSNDGDHDDVSKRILPFGSRLLPTACGRGAALANINLSLMDQEIDSTLLDGCAVLGKIENSGVPIEIRKIEDENQLKIELRASILQMRNELHRQRRIRILNQRSHALSQERSHRIEALVAEMSTDLKTLKRRLGEEFTELGISVTEAEDIVSAYYRSLELKSSMESPAHKRARRLSKLDSDEADQDEDEEDEDDDELIVHAH